MYISFLQNGLLQSTNFSLRKVGRIRYFLYLFDFTERSICFADHIIAHDGDTVVGAAYAVWKFFLPPRSVRQSERSSAYLSCTCSQTASRSASG